MKGCESMAGLTSPTTKQQQQGGGAEQEGRRLWDVTLGKDDVVNFS